MALLYTLVMILAVVLLALAVLRERRLQRKYERLEQRFKAIEKDCKADEVQLGRPMAYAAQLQLLSAYNVKEKARQRWLRANRSRQTVSAVVQRGRALKGRTLPYTFGLIDMAVLWSVLTQLGLERYLHLDWPHILERVRSLFG